jgi:hypothetical protein
MVVSGSITETNDAQERLKKEPKEDVDFVCVCFEELTLHYRFLV